VGLGLGAEVGPGEGPGFGGPGLGPLGEGLDGVQAWVLEIGQVLVLEWVLEWDHQERGQVWVLERGSGAKDWISCGARHGFWSGTRRGARCWLRSGTTRCECGWGAGMCTGERPGVGPYHQ
jgi:hypothetical protein